MEGGKEAGEGRQGGGRGEDRRGERRGKWEVGSHIATDYYSTVGGQSTGVYQILATKNTYMCMDP